MRWDSPPVLVVIGTLAIHVMLLTAGDAIATYTRFHPEEAPQFELFDIVEPPPEVKPPPPPVAPPPEDHHAPEPVLPAPPQVSHVRTATPRTATPPTPVELPPDHTPPTPSTEGGGPTVAIADLAPAAHGVAVRGGPTTTGHVGRGGTGTGTGTGTGSGSAAPAPMSVATIKTRALPRGDYSYFGAGKDYPAEAKQQSIEGVIRVRLIVDARGKVSSVTALNHLGSGLDELADRYAHAIEFDPARDTDDQPVASVVVWTFQFTLPH